MIILTREAVAAVQGAIDRAGKPGLGLRLSAESNGCAGPRYSMRLEGEPQADDVVLEIRDVRVFVDPDSMALLAGTTVGFSSSLEGSGFTFENPNIGSPEFANSAGAHSCSCGKSCG